MHFDDRLGTVLRLRAEGAAMRRIQYRQLIDLLGIHPTEMHTPQIDAAFARLGELAKAIPANERATMLGDPGLRLRSPRLVAALASGDLAVSNAVLAKAQLSEVQWLDLIPALPVAARGHMRQRRDLGPTVEAQMKRLGIRDRGLPPAKPPVGKPEPEAAALPDDQLPDNNEQEGIGALVRRIEAYRRAKRTTEATIIGDSPRLPLGEEHVLHVPAHVRAFDFVCDASGRITWADPGVAPMVSGILLGGPNAGSGSLALGEVLKRRQPLRGLRLDLAGAAAICGQWQADASPWFDPLTGRFIGYRGRMRRPALASPPTWPSPPAPHAQSDRMRQMLHELRTPVNAIQGFAEVIQQQLFGPTPHEYRALSATIAGDAARIMAAFEELERLARLDSAAMELESGESDLATIVQTTIAQLSVHTKQRDSGFSLDFDGPPLPVPLARIEVERIIWRILATLAGVSAPGERLRLHLARRAGFASMQITLPTTLASRTEEELFRASAGAIPQVIAAGVFGVGFALRLAAAEARAAGGSLARSDNMLHLDLPVLTVEGSGHSQGIVNKGASVAASTS